MSRERNDSESRERNDSESQELVAERFEKSRIRIVGIVASQKRSDSESRELKKSGVKWFGKLGAGA